MRISTAAQIAIPAALLAFSLLLMTGAISTSGLYDAYQRLSSTGIGKSATAHHTATSTASIAPLDAYTYPGQLDAQITFRDAEGGDTVFDLHYPSDYNTFHDGFGPLWLANWRPYIANNPQVSPVLGNSCLQTIRGETLASSMRYRTGSREYIVCRVLDEPGPDAPRSYDISQAKPAVIGVIWAARNHQPIDYPRERCVAEARIWATEIAQPDDHFMACVYVANEEPQQIEIHTFELTEDRIVEVGGAGEAWSRAAVAARDAPRLMQFRLMQDWLANPQTRVVAMEQAYSHIVANLDQVVPKRISKFDGVEQKNGTIHFTFTAKSTAEMQHIVNKSKDEGGRHLFQHLRNLVCGSEERAALIAFQENAVTYTYELNRSNGQPMTFYGAFPNLPC